MVYIGENKQNDGPGQVLRIISRNAHLRRHFDEFLRKGPNKRDRSVTINYGLSLDYLVLINLVHIDCTCR